MSRWPVILSILLVLTISGLPGRAERQKPSVDTGECHSSIGMQIKQVKSPLFENLEANFRAYAKIQYHYVASAGTEGHCHVVYRLFVSNGSESFSEIKNLVWDTEPGEFAGIELIGVSPSRKMFAADFWLAEGDGVEHRPVVFDLKTKKVAYHPLRDAIQKRIHSCDQNEDFIGVTDAGEAIFAIPASDYDDSPECGDKGTWSFNLQTGNVIQVAKISGDKWR